MIFLSNRFFLNVFVSSIFCTAKSRAFPLRINRQWRGTAFANDNKLFSISIWAETRRRWWNPSRRPKEFHGKCLPLASLLLSFSLCRDRLVQAFSFLVYPDTLSPGVSACWLITYLGNNSCVFPFANVHLSTSLWETGARHVRLRRNVRIKAHIRNVYLL